MLVRQSDRLEARMASPRESGEVSYEISTHDGAVLLGLTREWAERNFPPDHVDITRWGYRTESLPWEPGRIAVSDDHRIWWSPSSGGSDWKTRRQMSHSTGLVRATCLGKTHWIQITRGQVRFLNHTWEEAQLLGMLGEPGCWDAFVKWCEQNRHFRLEKYPLLQDHPDPKRTAAARLLLTELEQAKLRPESTKWSGDFLVLRFALPDRSDGTWGHVITDPLDWYKAIWMRKKSKLGEWFVLDGARREWMSVARPGRVRVEWHVRDACIRDGGLVFAPRMSPYP